jgi:hypothetical protein
MHPEIREHLEDILAGSPKSDAPVQMAHHPTPNQRVRQHLDQCAECRDEVAQMQIQAAMLAGFHGPELEPRPGFYARVIERIGAQGPVSIWNLFIESTFGRRIAVAALSLAVLLGAVLYTVERGDSDTVTADRDSVPANLLHPGGAYPASALEQDQPMVQSVSMGGGSGSVIGGSDMMIPEQIIFNMDLSANDQASQDEMLMNLMTYREQ